MTEDNVEKITENDIENVIKNVHTLEECLMKASAGHFPKLTKKADSYWNRYERLKEEFKDYPVETGALIQSIETWIQESKEKIADINKLTSKKQREYAFAKVFESDPMIYLNKHGESHIMDVQKRALSLIKHFRDCRMTFYELYILMCAVVVHDIGNIHGRAGHEEDIERILSQEKYHYLIPDANERRIICRVARTHGGAYDGSKDTISVLKEYAPLNGFRIRERLLAAILRLSDELADDYTRAADDAVKSGIVSEASQIYHQYSQSLHTVRVQKQKIDEEEDIRQQRAAYEIHLVYSFDSDVACTKFKKLGTETYLIDEIYDRTIKMERERRYCMRFMRTFISLESIRVDVDINHKFDSLKSYAINYELKERGYPPVIYKTMGDIGQELKTGCELEAELKNEGYY